MDTQELLREQIKKVYQITGIGVHEMGMTPEKKDLTPEMEKIARYLGAEASKSVAALLEGRYINPNAIMLMDADENGEPVIRFIQPRELYKSQP